MRRRSIPAFCIAILCIVLPLRAQESRPDAAGQLQPVFNDDFMTDTRDDYQIAGDVSWNKGQLTLAEGASITREINGGAWAKVALSLEPNNRVANQQPTELRVWFIMDGATSCFVRLQSHAPDEEGRTGSVALIDTAVKDGMLIEQIVREQPLTKNSVHSLTLEYRHGLVRVTGDDQPLLIAHIQNGAAMVDSCRIDAFSGNRGLRNVAVFRTQRPADLTAEQQEQLAKAAAANQELFSLYRHSKFSEAADVGERVLEINKSVLGEQHPDYAMRLNNLAAIYQRMGDSARAEPLFKQALEINKSVLGEQHPDYATSLNNLALLYNNMGDFARAEPLQKQALEIRKSVLGEQHPDYATSLNNLATLYYSMGDFARAEPLYKQALEIHKSVLGEQHPDSATSLDNLAGLYDSMGDSARAEPLYKQALEIRKSVLGEQHPDYALSLNNLAALYYSMGDFARAEPLQKQALEIRKSVRGEQHPNYANSLNNLAAIYQRMGDSARAEPRFKQALEIQKSVLGEQHPHYATSLGNLAVLYDSMGDSARAEPLYKQAVNIQRVNLNRSSLVQSERQQNRNQSAKRFYLDNRLTISLQLPKTGDAALTDLWQWKGAVTARQQAYRQVASNPRLAPLFAELQSVSHQLSAVSGQTPVPPANTAPDVERTAYNQKREIWNDRFAVLNRQREDLEQRIAAGSEEFRRIREPLTVADVQGWLPEGTAFVDVLEYNHSTPNPDQKGKTDYERRYLAFVVLRDQPPMMIGLGSAASLSEAITVFRRPFRVGEYTPANHRAAEAAGRQLRRDLWLPIEKHLDGIDTVIVSPDMALGTLPFGALPGRKEGSYLLEDYRIAVLPMANLLPTLFQDEPTAAKNGLLLVGDVDYDAQPAAAPSHAKEPRLLADIRGLRGGKGRWESLTGFREELESVHGHYLQAFGDTAPVLSLTGRDAAESTFLAQAAQYRTLHLITHGYFEDPNVKSISQAEVKSDAFGSQAKGPDPFINTYLPGLLSGLVMAGANNPSEDPEDPRDGILRASEIEASSMQGVDVVVLSACETGLGAVAGGEGLTGLQRAFHMAGARTVIASLWKVDDRGTQELMRRFYTNLWHKKLSKIDALREAQLWMLRHPKELEEMGVRGVGTRGRIRDLKADDPKPINAGDVQRTDPYFWAAFQLSGDWR
jgi:CHAT domain-containing protein/tetratricopeptide (TPR) repeat protein